MLILHEQSTKPTAPCKSIVKALKKRQYKGFQLYDVQNVWPKKFRMRPTLGNCCAFELTLILFHSMLILCTKRMLTQGNSPLYPNLNEIQPLNGMKMSSNP
jgi:hypothetical protein